MTNLEAAKIIDGTLFFWSCEVQKSTEGWVLKDMIGVRVLRVRGPFETEHLALQEGERLRDNFLSLTGSA